MEQLNQLNAWVMSTYQRLERLNVPVFDTSVEREILPLQQTYEMAHLRLLATDLPTEKMTLQEYLQNAKSESIVESSTLQKLSLLFRYLASPMRYEPHNESAVHKAVPSARCMYPLTFILVIQNKGELQAYKYVPDFHALQLLGTPSPVISSLRIKDVKEGMSLLCIGNIWKTAEKYGEFGHFPCVLESGHAFSQLHLLLSMLDWPSTPCNFEMEQAQSLCKSDLDAPLFGVGIDTIPNLEELPFTEVKLATVLENSGLTERFSRLAEMQRLFTAGAFLSPVDVPKGNVPEAFSKGSKGLLDTLRSRQSGNDRSGMSPVMQTLPDDHLEQVLSLFTALRGRRGLSQAEKLLSFNFAWLADSGAKPGLYDEHGIVLNEGMSAQELRDNVQNILPYKMMRFNTAAMTLVCFITAEPIQAIAELGDSAFRNIHIAAGASAQDLGIAAASLGMFSRPVRMMREERIEQALPVKGHVLYQVMCGFNRRHNLTFEVL
jgi:hypothetical protein